MTDPPLDESELEVTDHIVRLRREDSMSISSVYVQAIRKQAWARTEADVRLAVSFDLVHMNLQKSAEGADQPP